MSELTHLEQKERFIEGLKSAASCCRELAELQKNIMWHNIAMQLDMLRSKGVTVLKNKSLSNSEVDEAINIYKKTYKVDGQ